MELRLNGKPPVNGPILLVDVSSVLYPLYHQSGDQPDPDWASKQAVSQIISLASDYAHAACCCDSGRSFRRELDATYKANRPEKDAPLIHQLQRTERELVKAGFVVWKQDGYEADDVIASACAQAWTSDVPVVIASNDKDLCQLVDERVTVLSLRSKAMMTPDAVREKFGVRPEQMGDYLALVGDSADNIKGVKGIGPKKAAGLLAMHGTLANCLLADIDRADANRARALVALRADATLDFDAIFRPRVPAPMEADPMSEALDAETTLETPTDAMKADNAKAPSTIPAEAQSEQALVKVAPVVTVESGPFERQLEPRSLGDTRVLSKWLHESQLFSGYGSPQAIMSIVLAGRELNLGTMASLRGFHVVKGRVTMAADLMRALVLASGKAEYFMLVERSAERATWATKRKGDPEATRLTFTLQEAKDAKLYRAGSAWETHQAEMIAKTASAKLCRIVYADLLFGLYAPEEMGGEEL